MIIQYILRPTTFPEDSEPRTISFTPENPNSGTPVDFIDGKIVLRPCAERHGIALKAFGTDNACIVPRGVFDLEHGKLLVPRDAIVMLNGGDRLFVNNIEYTFVIESIVAKKMKLTKKTDNNGDDDDDDDWSSSSSFSDSDDDDDDDDDKDKQEDVFAEEKDIQLSPEKERLFDQLAKLYPDTPKHELQYIAQNTESVYDAIATIFDPSKTSDVSLQPVNPLPPKNGGAGLLGSGGSGSGAGSSSLSMSISTSGTGAPAPSAPPMEMEVDPDVKRLVEEFQGLTIDQAQTAYLAADKEYDVAKKFIEENMAALSFNNKRGGGGGGNGVNDDDGDNGGGGGFGGFIRGGWNRLRNKVGLGHNNNNNNAAAAGGGDGGDANVELNDQIEQLRVIFPNASLNVLKNALVMCGNNVEGAVDKLLMMDPADLNTGAAAAGAGAGDDGDDDGFGNNKYYDEPPTAPPPAQLTQEQLDRKMKEMRGMTVNVDPSLPWQSSGEATGDFERYIFDNVKFITNDLEMQHTAERIQTMIDNEQHRYRDSYCFYHSYSVAHLDYELNALIATIVYDLDLEQYGEDRVYNLDFVQPPVPRASFKPFTYIKSIKELSNFCTGGRNNNDPNYQAVGLSVSTSIFSKGSPAPPVELFRRGYSAVNVDFTALMKGLLAECGFNTVNAKHIIDVLEKTAKRYNMPVGKAGFDGISKKDVRATGHMLQIFINKSIVDQYAYPSQCLGYRDGTKTMSETFKAGKTNGQARLYISPDLLRSPKYSRLYYYCADPHFSEKRIEFVRDVKKQLSYLFLDETIRKMIKHNLRLKYGPIPA